VIGDGALAIREFLMWEPLPLARIHDAVFEFLRGRTDAVVFGAHAVNAYVSEPRMTQDVDIVSNRAAELAETLCEQLSATFQIDVRNRRVEGNGRFRLDQIRDCGKRHLVDIDQIEPLPDHWVIEEILFPTPAELVARKAISYASRRGAAKSLLDLRDISVLMIRFPELRSETGPVAKCLNRLKVGNDILDAWKKVVTTEIRTESDPDWED
jgi:hypothetical protein